MTRVETYTFVDAAMRRAGRPVIYDGGAQPPVSSRDSLVYGQYMPTLATTGVPDFSILTNYNAPGTNAVTLPANSPPINDKTIYGDITPPSTGGIINVNRCHLRGGTNFPTSDTGILRATGARRASKIIFTDCTFDPIQPANGRNGTLGAQYELYRCNIFNCTDGVGIYSPDGANQPADVTVMGCYIHDLLYDYPDPATSGHDDGAHTDCIQHQGGLNVLIRGNYLHGSAHASPTSQQVPSNLSPDLTKATRWVIPDGWANGACIIVQEAGTRTVNTTTIVEDNWTWGGLAHYNIKSTAPSFIIRRGHVFRAAARHTNSGATGDQAWSGYWVRFDAGMDPALITGLDTLVWEDGTYAGQTLKRPRDLGITVGST